MRRRVVASVATLTVAITTFSGVTLAAASPDDAPAGVAPASAQRFVDVPASNQFQQHIHWLADENITTGWPDNTFRPTLPVERQAMAAFLFRHIGDPSFAAPVVASFADVPIGHPFFREIEWLADSGVTTGWNMGTHREFRPTNTVERQAMAAFLYRAADCPVFTASSTARFTDVPVGAAFFLEIEWLASTGVTTGFPDNTFRPTQNVERQAMAAFLYRATDQGLFGSGPGCPVITPPPVQTPPAPQPPAGATVGNGRHMVGTGIAPGIWVSSGESACYWERRSNTGTDFDGIIENSFGGGQRIVEVRSTDVMFVSNFCGTWRPIATLSGPNLTATSLEGIYSVGNGAGQLRPGLYRVNAEDSGFGCYVASLTGFSGSVLEHVRDNSFFAGSALNTTWRVLPTDAGFETARCSWTRIGD